MAFAAPPGEHGLGLYYHDCRFLNGYEMPLADATPEVLVSTASRGFIAILELANPDIKMAGGAFLKEELGIEWKRVIDSSKLMLCDAIQIDSVGAPNLVSSSGRKTQQEKEKELSSGPLAPN